MSILGIHPPKAALPSEAHAPSRGDGMAIRHFALIVLGGQPWVSWKISVIWPSSRLIFQGYSHEN